MRNRSKRPDAKVAVGARLVDAAGVPQPGVTLRYRGLARSGVDALEMFPLADTGDETLELTTDADGRFTLDVDVGRRGSLVLPREANRLFGETESRRLVLAAQSAAADLGDVVAIPAVSVRGRVVDAQDKPVTTAKVRANRKGEAGFALWRPGDGASVDADGRFELLGLAPGELEVAASSPGFVPTRSTVEASAGAVADDVVLRMTRGASVSGTVADERGAPIAGAKVVAFRNMSTAPGVDIRAFDASEAVETDATGYFELSGLLGERVALRAWCPGHEPQQLTDVMTGTVNVSFRLRRLATISGRVLNSADRTVPMVGSQVTATRVQGTEGATGVVPEIAGRSVSATTDEEGRYVIEGVAPGRVRVVASGDGHLDSRPFEVRVAPGEQLDYVDLYVETGAAVEATVLGPDQKPVEGAVVTVLEPEDTPPAGDGESRAFRVRAESGEIQFGPSRVLGEATTDADGIARVTGLPAGRAVLRATHAAHAPAADEYVTLPRNRTTDWVATLRAAGFVALTARDSDGSPLADARFVLKSEVEGVAAVRGRTGGDGTARVGPLLPGRYTAMLELPPRATDLGGGGMSFVLAGAGGDELEQTAKPVDVAAERTVELVLERPVLTRLHGVVKSLEGPVSGATVRIRKSEDMPFQARVTKSDRDGRYELTDLLPGTYQLEWSKSGALVPHRTSLDVQPLTPELELDLELGGGSVRLTVVSARDDRPLAGATVRIERPAEPGGTVQRSMRMVMVARSDDDAGGGGVTSMTLGGAPAVETDANGVAVLEDIPAGTFLLTVSHDDHVDGERADVVVVDRQLTDAGSLVLDAAGTITGALTNWPDGVPAEVAMIEVRRVGDEEGQPRMETVQGRRYRIGGLASGEYELRAQPIGLGGRSDFGPAQKVTVEPGATAEVDLALR